MDSFQRIQAAYILRFVIFVLLASFSGLSNANDGLSERIDQLMQEHHYRPTELAQPGYLEIKAQAAALFAQNQAEDALIDSFNQLWSDGPFSHVRMAPRQQSAEQLAAFLDTLSVGGNGALLSWQDDIAVLTVNTMMGQDTIAQIDQAYQEISKAQALALIIDLRMNDGGAFAVKPLVSHLLNAPLEAGAFVSQDWFEQHDGGPTMAQTLQYQPWQGWSIRTFWHDVESQAVTRIQFQPTLPHYSGAVYVLTSRRTASAAELAADALGNLANVTLIGEVTEGAMLSQKVFDLTEQLQLFLPIADYYSHQQGRIEGNGVKPDIQVASDQALARALQEIAQRE